MARRNSPIVKIAALLLLVGIPTLLCVGLAYDLLSLREWAIGLLAWFAVLVSWMVVVKLGAKKTTGASAEPEIVPNDHSRRGIARRIWVWKTWIGVLIVLLPIGVVDGIAQRAWLPTLVGAAISLLWIYVAAQGIKQSRKRLTLPR